MSTKPPPRAPLDPLQRYTINEAASYLRIHRCTLYNDIAAGLIATIKDRKRRFVPGAEIARLSAVGLETSLKPAPAIQDETFPRPVDRASSPRATTAPPAAV